jgi:anti-sigma B factor antagonist
MDISEQQIGRVWIVVARGRLDGATSGAFAQRIDALMAAGEPRLVVDFSGIDFVSSAGLRVVLTLVKKVKAMKGVLALCAVQAPVQEVLDITGFAGMIDIHPERTAALAALA